MKKSRYLSNESAWLLAPLDSSSYEVVVAGDETGPDPARLALVEAALSSLAELRAEAVAYLDAFVERGKFAGSQQWFFEGLQSGRSPFDKEDQFRMLFSIEGDTYGEWAVAFQLSNARFFPVAFSRRQI